MGDSHPSSDATIANARPVAEWALDAASPLESKTSAALEEGPSIRLGMRTSGENSRWIRHELSSISTNVDSGVTFDADW
jgi:hypothetical protein